MVEPAAGVPEQKLLTRSDRKSIAPWGFFGRTPPFTLRQRRVFTIATTAGFFDQYDRALLSLALKQIQTGLKIAESQLGAMLSVIRLGYVLSLLMTPLADVFGRRRLLLYTVVGYTAFTALSAIAPGEKTFVVFQVLARAFAGAEAAVAVVILAEEVDAAHRGWAIGLLGAVSNIGYGLAALVFAFVNVIPYGWRGLYAIALVPLVLIIPLRRVLPESARFEKEQSEGSKPSKVWEPLVQLYSAYPKRLLMMLSVMFLASMGGNAAGIMFPKFLQEAHGWSPGNVSSLFFFGGALSVMGSIAAGRLSDRFGRRVMGATFFFLAPLMTIWMYTATGFSIVPVWILESIFRHRVRHDHERLQRGDVPDLVSFDRGQRARGRGHDRRRDRAFPRRGAVQPDGLACAVDPLSDGLLADRAGDHVVLSRDVRPRIGRDFAGSRPTCDGLIANKIAADRAATASRRNALISCQS